MKKTAYLVLILCNHWAIAQTSEANNNTLTGDWGGSRSWLNDNGIKLNPRVSTFTSTGFQNSKNDTEFGGKADLAITINGEKLGLWKGMNIISHAEYNFGNSLNGTMGTLLPINTGMVVPGAKNEKRFDLTSLYLLQKIGANKNLMLGKINMVDVAEGSKFIGGAGIETFQHINFVAPPSGLVPPYIFGALLSIKTKPLNYTFGIYDPISAVNKTGLEAPFNKGVTFYASLEKITNFGGKTGAHNLKAVYSTQNGVSLSNLSDIIINPELTTDIPTKKERYYIGYSFHQYLIQSSNHPNQGWGIFGNIGFSDTNPTPLDWSFIIGLGGNSLFKNRTQDNWGLGLFHQSIANSLKYSATVLNKEIKDETGLEAFYNYQVMPYFKIGIHAKWINPAFRRDDAYFFGLRTIIKL